MVSLELRANILKAIYVLVRKDLVLDYRSPLHVTTQAIFSLASGVLAGLIQRKSIWGPETLLPVSLSIVLVFQGIFSSYISFMREREYNTIDSLRLLPIPPETVYIAKSLYTILNILSFTLIFLGSIIFFSGLHLEATAALLVWTLSGSVLVGSVASLASAMMIYTSSPGSLAPMLIITLTLPFFNASSQAINTISQGYMPQPGWEAPLLGYSIGFLTAATLLSRYLLE